ncbi:MAG: hypothetical protein RIC19_23695 [Phaeodactylibacter sp.]|uniref:tetratricopeptide repeat protein n=1 Tax=Phaeodactylibacter sp. TaxID=1940289 RepID=UPI0032EDA595
MATVYLRYLLIALFFILGAVLQFKLGISQAWYLYLGGGMLILTQVFMGNVWTAHSLLKRGKAADAERVLDQVWSPRLLLRRNRAYYYFSLGLIYLQRKDFTEANDMLTEAVDLGLEHPNDSALACLNLAHIHYVQMQPEQAQHWMEKARSFPTDDLLVKENLHKLEQALAARNN